MLQYLKGYVSRRFTLPALGSLPEVTLPSRADPCLHLTPDIWQRLDSDEIFRDRFRRGHYRLMDEVTAREHDAKAAARARYREKVRLALLRRT